MTVGAGSTSISLGASSGAATAIAAGDLVVVIQMQNATINSSDTDPPTEREGPALDQDICPRLQGSMSLRWLLVLFQPAEALCNWCPA
jgi:hypothetical protein